MLKNDTQYVFVDQWKDPFKKNKIISIIRKFNLNNIFKMNWRPHDIRISYGVNYIKDGGEVKNMQYILGHSHINDTKKIFRELIT